MVAPVAMQSGTLLALGGLDGEFMASKRGDGFVSKVGDSSREIGQVLIWRK